MFNSGEIVYFENVEYEISQPISLEEVLAKNTETGEYKVLKIRGLQLRPNKTAGPDTASDTRHDDVSQIPGSLMEKAKTRYKIIEPLIGKRTTRQVKMRAKEHKVSAASIYNWINAYAENPKLSSLAFEGTKGGKGKSRLDDKAEAIINSAIEDYYLSPQKQTDQKVYEEVALRCRRANVNTPSLATVSRRIQNVDAKRKIKAREGKDKLHALKPIQGEYPDGNFPLETVQIDHTRLDVILVDDVYRHEMGRPWLTLAIDSYSRAVFGYYISMDAPGFFGTGQCIATGVLTKERITDKFKTQSPWPVWGIPQQFIIDNAREFIGLDLERFCQEYHITIIRRPVKKAHFGGIIERLNETLNQDVHSLKGTTFSNIQKRGNYDSQKEAVLTLNELEEILVHVIVDKYHNSIHSSLGMTPIKKYEEGILGSADTPARGLPRKIENEELLKISLLPYEERSIQPYGVQIDCIQYYDPVLNSRIAEKDPNDPKRKRKFLFRKDPRDISRIFYYDPDDKRYYTIPYRNTRHPAISIWEFKAAKKHLKAQANREYGEDEIFNAIEHIRRVEENAAVKTKEMRKKSHRRIQIQNASLPKPKDGGWKGNDDKTPEDDVYDDLTPYEGIEDG